MNTCNLSYHILVMSQCTEMMGKFLQCGLNTEYDILQLLAALDLNIMQQPANYGKMIAVIRYCIPYLINKWDPLTNLFCFR